MVLTLIYEPSIKCIMSESFRCAYLNVFFLYEAIPLKKSLDLSHSIGPVYSVMNGFRRRQTAKDAKFQPLGQSIVRILHKESKALMLWSQNILQ